MDRSVEINLNCMVILPVKGIDARDNLKLIIIGNRMNPAVDKYISAAKAWTKELSALRKIILECGLTEELKWGSPCYVFQKTNLVIIGELKECCVLSFFNGTLLSDANGILIKPGPNTQTVRIIRFTSVREIVQMEPILKAYIYEAIEVEKAGLKVNLEEKDAIVLPEEFQNRLNENAPLKAAFEALTPGRQRAYNIYFSAPKQSRTRASRVEKCIKQILSGKGLND